MFEESPAETLAMLLDDPTHTAKRIREARMAVLLRTHLQKRIRAMPDVVPKASGLSNEQKRDQMLADNFYPAVAEIAQGRIAGVITRYLVRKGARSIADMF